MTDFLFRVKSFFSWWLEAVDEHSLHSPFFFDLYTRQIKPGIAPDQYSHIESLRQKLLTDRRYITVRDLGSKGSKKATRMISAIARTSMSPARYSIIYARLANYMNAGCILELGTSFGINTLYLAEKSDATVTTFEGAPAIAEIAALTFEFAGKKNVDLIMGNIDKTLPAFLHRIRRIDLALIDANHRYEPTIRYFEHLLRKVHERSVIVVDDIHYSAEMQKAWKDMQAHRLVYGSADLFRCGILFFDPSLNKQHVILQV